MDAQATQAFVQEWIDRAWNGRELTLVDRYMGSEYQLHQSDGTEVRGPEQFKGYMLQLLNAFSDLHFTVHDVIAQGDRVAWRVIGRGTHDGPLHGVEPTGRTIEVNALILSTIAEGRWVEDFVIIDSLSMLVQLGIIPAPTAAV